MEKVKKRESNVEIIRIIAILLIMLSHSVPFYENQSLVSFVNLDFSTGLTENIIMIFIRSLGQVGDVLFIICSAYFLVDSKNAKISKIVKIFLDTTIISLICFFVAVNAGAKYDESALATSLFPTIYRKNYWFICCYLLMYMIHPLLNTIINNINQRKLLLVNICFITFYSVINMLYDKAFFYTELVGFIEIYFIIAYMKKYMINFSKSKWKNIYILFFSIVAYMLFISIIDVLGCGGVNYYSDKMLYWVVLTNPFVILASIAIFNLFRRIKVQSNIINFIASLTLLVYIISDNYFLRENMRPYIFEKFYGQYNVLLLVLFEFLKELYFSIIIAIIYRCSIKIVTDKVADLFSRYFEKIGKKVLNNLEKID